MVAPLASVSYAARPRVLLKYLGQAGIVLAALQLAPAAVALGVADYEIAAVELGLAAVLGLVCYPLQRFAPPERTLAGEALAVAALAFLGAALLLFVPFRVGGLGTVDALFEAVSAVTTTGLTTLRAVENLPLSLLFLRAWGQWFGGLGIVVFAVALLSQHPAMARRLLGTDPSESLDTTARNYARRVALTYAALTGFGIVLLIAFGAAPAAGVMHALSAISTGGFSSLDAGLRGLGAPPVWFATAFVSLCGAVSLPLYSALRARRFRRFFFDEELLGLLGMLVLVWALLTASLYRGGAVGHAVRDGALLAVFAQTTTGYATVDLGALSSFAKLVLIVSMTIGGTVGSTAGGVKIFRVLLLLRFGQLALRRLRVPEHALAEFRLRGRRYEDSELLGALFYVLLFLGIVLLSWLAFLAGGYAPLDSLFEVTSAVGTVGLSTGVTQSGLGVPLKLVLAFDMLAGRVEILALLVLVQPGLWWGRRLET